MEWLQDQGERDNGGNSGLGKPASPPTIVFLLLCLFLITPDKVNAVPAPNYVSKYTYDKPASLDYGIRAGVMENGDVVAVGRVGNGCGGTGDIYVCRLDADLRKKWETTIDVGCGDNYPAGLALHGGNIYVCGYGIAALDDGFVIKVDGAGNTKWTYQDAADPHDGYRDIVVNDADGLIYVLNNYYDSFPSYSSDLLKLRDQGTSAVSVGEVPATGLYSQRVWEYSLDLHQGAFYCSGKNISGPPAFKAYAGIGPDAGLIDARAQTCAFSISMFDEETGFVMMGRQNSGEPVTVGKVDIGENRLSGEVQVGTVPAGMGFPYGQVAVHPALSLVVAGIGGKIYGFNTEMDQKWVQDVPGNPWINGVTMSAVNNSSLYLVGSGGGVSMVVLKYEFSNPAAGKQKLVVMPNLLNHASPHPYVVFQLYGTPGAQPAIDIYDIRGNKACSLKAPLDGRGYCWLKWDGRNESGVRIADGMYWAVARGGGVSAKVRLMISSLKRGNNG